jgi:hypothetical protein
MSSSSIPSTRRRCHRGPAALLARPPGGLVWCAITDGDKQAKVKVEIDDKLTVVRRDIATPPGSVGAGAPRLAVGAQRTAMCARSANMHAWMFREYEIGVAELRGSIDSHLAAAEA